MQYISLSSYTFLGPPASDVGALLVIDYSVVVVTAAAAASASRFGGDEFLEDCVFRLDVAVSAFMFRFAQAPRHVQYPLACGNFGHLT